MKAKCPECNKRKPAPGHFLCYNCVERRQATAWLLTYKGATIHLAKQDGWEVEPVVMEPDDD